MGWRFSQYFVTSFDKLDRYAAVSSSLSKVCACVCAWKVRKRSRCPTWRVRIVGRSIFSPSPTRVFHYFNTAAVAINCCASASRPWNMRWVTGEVSAVEMRNTDDDVAAAEVIPMPKDGVDVERGSRSSSLTS